MRHCSLSRRRQVSGLLHGTRWLHDTSMISGRVTASTGGTTTVTTGNDVVGVVIETQSESLGLYVGSDFINWW